MEGQPPGRKLPRGPPPPEMEEFLVFFLDFSLQELDMVVGGSITVSQSVTGC